MLSPTLREALAALRRAPLLTGLSAGMVALALFVAGLFGTVTHNLQVALQSVEDRVAVVAYILDNASPAAIDRAVTSLEDRDDVREVRYVSQERALEIARTELPELAELGSGLAENPFPASLEIVLADGMADPESIALVADAASAIPIVEDVQYGQEWVERLHALRRIAGVAVMVIGAAFAVVGALIIGTAIRIAIFARRDEIYIMRLVGAKDAFIRRPFLLEGAFTGVVGGAAATALTWLTYQTLLRFLGDLSWIPATWVVGGIAAGGFFGMLASAVAVRRHLREV
ncbi:MAG: ABC transporter permease [Gemmatimonadetes bacterium]|nr:ABC transporter permease [Gemmatimonadota bacterium]